MLWIIYSIIGVHLTSFRWEKLSWVLEQESWGIISARLVFCFGFLLSWTGMT